MKKPKLFITGMSGTAGRILAKLSLNEKYLVGGTIHQNIPADLKTLIAKGSLKPFHIDLKNQNEIDKALQDFQPNVVVHLAGKVLGGTDKRVFDYSIYEENILIFNNTLNAIKGLNTLPRFILCSGCLVYNKQTSSSFITEIPIWDLPEIDHAIQPYRASKAEQEKILTQSKNLDYIIARPTQFTGPGKIPGTIEWFIASEIIKIKRGETKNIHVKNKLGEVDILDVRDVASALLILINKGIKGEVYHISSGIPVTVDIVAKTFMDIVGLEYNKFPLLSTETETGVFFRFSPAKLKSLGWKPKYKLKDALTSYWEYFKQSQTTIQGATL